MRVLLLESDCEHAERFERMLREAIGDSLEVARDGPLAAGLERLAAAAFDVVFCALRLPDSYGVETVDRLLSAHPDVPVVVLCRPGDDELAYLTVEHGAQEVLFQGSVEAGILRHVLRCARARHRFGRSAAAAEQRDQWLRELGLLERYSPEMKVAARNFSTAPLRDTRPNLFRELVEWYALLLDQSLEQRVLKVDHHLSEQLASLSDALGRVAAVPRDLLDLHRAALESRVRGGPPKRQEAYAAEGRLLLLGLMAKLVSYYRIRSISIADPSSAAREAPHG